MVWPKSVPLLTDDDFHTGLTEFQVGSKRNIIGWFQHLFLFSREKGDVIITHEDNNHYERVMELLRKRIVKRDESVYDKVDMLSPSEQNRLYHSIIKELGYNEEIN